MHFWVTCGGREWKIKYKNDYSMRGNARWVVVTYKNSVRDDNFNMSLSQVVEAINTWSKLGGYAGMTFQEYMERMFNEGKSFKYKRDAHGWARRFVKKQYEKTP